MSNNRLKIFLGLGLFALLLTSCAHAPTSIRPAPGFSIRPDGTIAPAVIWSDSTWHAADSTRYQRVWIWYHGRRYRWPGKP